MGAGGVSPPPRPLRAERRPRDILNRLWRPDTRSALRLHLKRPCVVRASYCEACKCQHASTRCSGVGRLSHAAYAPLASWRISTKSPSPPFEAARPIGFQPILRKPGASYIPMLAAVAAPRFSTARMVVFEFSPTPLRRLLRRRRDSPTLPAHGRCRPVAPASLREKSLLA